ncbi:MAG: hypothetical protein H0T53_14340 [Herpetosiphonaceae bacterium]|nr:hypothetical protein [Herpetosiphonaceae bacterium]
MRRVLYVLPLLILLTVIIPQRQAEAQQICFQDDPEVLRCVADPLSGYWSSNGGLPVFGFPLTEIRPEHNIDLNQAIKTQWLERHRLEVHPENPAPYTILLGRIGVERLEQIGRNPAAEGRESGPRSGCLWFVETGHNVCNQAEDLGFKHYWESHGLAIQGLDSYARSLQLFGLPLTELRLETNSSGDTVLTQWFERARFEWHPTNPDAFKVLLGRLGAEVRTPPTSTPQSVFGVEILSRNGVKTADQAADANASLVRYNAIAWSEVEATQGVRRWAAVASREAELRAFGERNLSSIVIIRGTPDWAQAVPGAACGAIKPAALDAFADFVYETVQRYSVPPYNVKYWEFGNEPDVDPALIDGSSIFGCWGDAKDAYYGGGHYAEMLKRVYPMVKRADPAAVVISGGLLLDCDPTLQSQATPCVSGKFLEGMLRNGGGDVVDVISYHAYSYWMPHGKDWNLNHPSWKHRGGVFGGKLEFVRSIMHKYGVRKPILMNEGGLLCYRSSPNCRVPEFYEAQANQVVRLYTRTSAQGLWASIWFTLDGPGWQEGSLLDANQVPRPAYNTFKFLSGLLKDASYECALGANALEGYGFRKGATTYLVYWTNDSSRVVINLPLTTRAIFNKAGNQISVEGTTIQAGFEPIIIEAAEMPCGR